MITKLKYLAVIPALAYSAVVFAAEDSIERVLTMIVDLIGNMSELSTVALAGAVIAILVQILKTPSLGNLFGLLTHNMQRLLILVLGQVAGILQAISLGGNALESVLAGLFASGFAVALYELVIKVWQEARNGK